ncbi:MAG: GNAT family protein [Edaphobacter sp.]|uniref:GNAT family N-acetyltransferase n=1 Tax=Edaphobacter sp. TaxID=1934404 RepID=UPI00239C2F40|nr:GNAT family protein [Edaphobacter sp.]MDE1178426.1 GNAT family protein [Edaphobacter sp.]
MTHPTLQGTHVRLQPLLAEHLPALEKIAFDDRIWRYMLTRVTNSEDLERWLASALKSAEAGTQLPWVTVRTSDGRVIGSTRFIDLDLHNKTVEIGHTWITPELHQAGINPEAKLLQLQYAFDTLGLNRVAFKTHHENLQSQAAIKKLGAVYEGTFRNHYVMPDGSLRHSVWFSITKEDWPQVRSRLEQRLASLPANPPSA